MLVRPIDRINAGKPNRIFPMNSLRRCKMDPALKEEILSVLKGATDMTIATIRPDGFPQATTVSYVSDGLTMGGTAKPVTDPNEINRVSELMLRKFPQILQYALAGKKRVFLVRIDP